MIQLFQPSLGPEELAAVAQVFESNWAGKGAMTEEFESDFATHLGVEKEDHVRSVSTCTEGLFQSMVLLGIGPEDDVILPTISHVSAGNAVASSGARPVFCDVDYRTLNATADSIEERMTRRTKAVVVLHYGGIPCDIDPICQLIEKRGIALIEDSACSIASRVNDRACGTFGAIGTWSFDAMKIAVAGDGGMMYFENPEMSRQFEKQISHGVWPPSGFASRSRDRWWEFDLSCFGRRATMNDICSAIGLVQLKKLPDFIRRRTEIHSFYDRELRPLDWLRLPPQAPAHVQSSCYLYWIQTEPELRDRLAAFLIDRDIYTTFRYYPLHWVKRYGQGEALTQAEKAAETTLCIPNHQSLSGKDLTKIVQSIVDFGKTV